MLKATDGGYEYYKYLFPKLEKINDTKCKPVINHFRGEKNASLSITKYNSQYRHLDFGDPTYKGNVFDIYATKHGIEDVRGSFYNILKGICKELNIEVKNSKNNNFKRELEEIDDLPEGVEYQIAKRSFEALIDTDNKFLEDNGLSPETLQRYNVSFLNHFRFRAQSGKCYQNNAINKNVILAHSFDKSVKTYRPNSDFKHQFLGGMSKGYYVGKEVLEALLERVISGSNMEDVKIKIVLAAGLRDTLNLAERGVVAISLNSETTTFIPEHIVECIKEMNECLTNPVTVHILYDNDGVGDGMAMLISEKLDKHKINNKIVSLPLRMMNDGGKDVSDWITLGYPIDELLEVAVGKDYDSEAHKSFEQLECAKSPISPQEYYTTDSNTNSIVNEPEITYEEVQELSSIRKSKKIITKKNSRFSQLKERIEAKKDNSNNENNIVGETSEIADNENNVSISLNNEVSVEVYNQLPNTFQKLCEPFNGEIKSMMLFSFITAMGSAQPNISCYFRNDKLYPNLFTVIIAPPASGKSEMKWARSLIMPIERYLENDSKNKLSDTISDLKILKK